MGTHQNKVDAKGRVSIPASFRAAIKALDGRDTVRLVLRPSHDYDCIEAWPEPEFKALEAPLQSLPMFSPEYDQLAFVLYTDAQTIESDKEGRISIPDSHVASAGLADTIVFMGFGKRFMIWEPAAAAAFRNTQKARQAGARITVPGIPIPPTTAVAPASAGTSS